MVVMRAGQTKESMAGWYVVCKDYEIGPFDTRVEAVERKAGIEKYGACDRTHKIVKR